MGFCEEIEAYYAMQWLGERAGSEEVLVYDIHDNSVPGNMYVAVGQRALQATLVGAYQLGFDKCLVDSTPFFEAVPNSALLELSVSAFPQDYHEAIDKLIERLDELATHGTLDGLQEQYADASSKLRFYSRTAIPTIGEDGQPADYMSDLERIHVPEAFTPLDLSDELRGALGIAGTHEIVSSSWGHSNMSRQMPWLGKTQAGVTRREYFGAYLIPISAPSPDGKWVVFPDEET